MGSHYFGLAPAPAQTAALLLSLLLFLFFFFSSSWHLPPFLKHILAEAPATLQWAVWCAAPGGFARCGAGRTSSGQAQTSLLTQVAPQTHTYQRHLPAGPNTAANEFSE